jgi:hypothetical protein
MSLEGQMCASEAISSAARRENGATEGEIESYAPPESSDVRPAQSYALHVVRNARPEASHTPPEARDAASDARDAPSDMRDAASDVCDVASDVRGVASDASYIPSEAIDAASIARDAPSVARDMPSQASDAPFEGRFAWPCVLARWLCVARAVRGEAVAGRALALGALCELRVRLTPAPDGSRQARKDRNDRRGPRPRTSSLDGSAWP